MVIIMILWIGNGAVLKTSSQWQLKEFWKLNNSVQLFIFQSSLNCHWLELFRTAPLPIHKVIIIADRLGADISKYWTHDLPLTRQTL